MKSRPNRRQIWHALDATVASGVRPVLATVIRAEGSTPLEAGARALVAPDGTLLAGTVGGGLLEFEATRRAANVAARGVADLFDFALAGPGGSNAHPICGGSVRVLLQPASDAVVAAHVEARRAEHDRREGVLETAIRRRNDQPPRTATTWFDDPPAATALGYFAEGDREGLREPVLPAPLLLIVGAGHVGQALAAHADLAGFDVAVIDDRQDLLTPDHFPPDCRLLPGPITDSLAVFPADHATYIALVSRGHRADADALAISLRKRHAYLGMIGSRRKARVMREEFLRSGLATAEEFDQIHTPIGLEIGAETAPEIAISIVAQLVAVKNARQSVRQ